MLLADTKFLSCQFYFNSTNYKKPQIVTDQLNIGPPKTYTNVKRLKYTQIHIQYLIWKIFCN